MSFAHNNYKESTDKSFYRYTTGPAPGGLNNDKIKHCRNCKANRFPHDAIAFEEIPGAGVDIWNFTLGRRVYKPKPIPLDYFNGWMHIHKKQQQ